MQYSDYEYKHFNFAKTARNFAFFAVITALFRTILFPFIFGSLAIIFAVLSKGNTQNYTINARIALITAILALVGNTILTVYVVRDFSTNPDTQQQFVETYEQFYGEKPDFSTLLPSNISIQE